MVERYDFLVIGVDELERGLAVADSRFRVRRRVFPLVQLFVICSELSDGHSRTVLAVSSVSADC